VASVNAKLASYETVKQFAVLTHDFTIEAGELTPSLKVKRRVADERYKDILAELY
jgi:long-chain acyl-CoA synthetase